ncbi:DUF1835 domain-containing protein [Cohnella sp. GCM10027633]|uniref:DUF1835 domain-containing protein n=1 Tax=unclassified Cohnella TaxID=2636738 RepID=UPI0036354354
MTDTTSNAFLHIVNGDIVGDQLRAASIGGDVLVWREIYTAGPLDARLAVRAEWLETFYGIPKQEYFERTEYQLSAFEQALQGGLRIALWIDPDLFDHAILMKLCHQAKTVAVTNRTSLELVALPAGPYSDDRLGDAWDRSRSTLRADEVSELASAWEAYAKNDRAGLELWVSVKGRKHPVTSSALRFHLNRWPGADGLGHVERITLTKLAEQAEGRLSKFKLFQLVSKHCDLFGMGDLQYWHILRCLDACEPPMISLRRDDVLLAEAGREVLSGKRLAPPRSNELSSGNA